MPVHYFYIGRSLAYRITLVENIFKSLLPVGYVGVLMRMNQAFFRPVLQLTTIIQMRKLVCMRLHDALNRFG